MFRDGVTSRYCLYKGTYRHNKVGQMIMRVVRDGTMGEYVVMMDLGKADEEPQGEHQQHDRQQLPHRIPREALPPGIPNRVKAELARKSIPDAFLYQPQTHDTPAKYVIVEIKYCRDTDPTQQLDAAKEQHRVLAEAIEEAAPEAQVQYVPVMLGVGGTIFKRYTTGPLEQLGLRKGAIKTLKYKLHRHAVKQIHWIYTAKRRAEAQTLEGKQSAPNMGHGTTRNRNSWTSKRKHTGTTVASSRAQAWKRHKK